MKRFMSMILMAAVVVTSVVVPNSNNVETVKAASVTYSVKDLTVNGQKYDNYEDFIEAFCIAWGYKNIDLNSYENETFERAKYTYADLYRDCGSEIPDDCISVLGNSYKAGIGYKSDGTKVVIYNKNGYDVIDWDREGYDKDGYDTHGYNREGYDSNGDTQEDNRNQAIRQWKEAVEMAAEYDFFEYINQYNKDNTKVKIVSTEIKSRLSDDAFYYNGKEYDFTKDVIIKKKNVNKDGFGEYTIICGDDDTVRVNVVKTPKIDISFGVPETYEKKYVEVFHKKIDLKYYDGLQIITSSKANGKGKVYFKKNYKLKAPSRKHYSYYPVYKYDNSKNAKYVTIRPYIQVNGKKYYANWGEESVRNKNTSGKGRIYKYNKNSL